MILKREGSRSKKKLRFRPAKVNAAVQWLMRNNPHYIDAISKGDLKYEPLPLPPGADKDAFQDVPAQFALTEEENDDVCEALKAGSSEAEHTAEGDITLLFTEPPLMSREEHIRLNMGVPSDRTSKDDVDVGLFPLSPSLSPPAPPRVPPAASRFSKDDGQVPTPVSQPPSVSDSPAPVSGTAAAAAPAVDPDATMKSIVSHLIHFKINEIKDWRRCDKFDVAWSEGFVRASFGCTGR